MVGSGTRSGGDGSDGGDGSSSSSSRSRDRYSKDAYRDPCGKHQSKNL